MSEKPVRYKNTYHRFKNKLFFVFYLLTNPKLFLYMLKGLHLPVLIQYFWLKSYQIKTIIDVGASRGNVSIVLANLFPDSTVYAFEPIKEEYEKMNSKIKSQKIITNCVGITDKVGYSPFYINNFFPASSLLPFNKSFDKFNSYPVEKKIKIATTTLDTYLLNKDIECPIFLKIDTQGSELLVLKGAKNLLQKVSIIHIETAYYEFYEKQALFDDIYEYLKALNFTYVGSANDSDFYPRFGLLSQSNSIFVNFEKVEYS